MAWFEESGLRARGAKMGGLPLTAKTRYAAVTDTLSLLRQLKLRGLEQLTDQHVVGLIPRTGPEDRKYRRVIHQLAAARTLFRACRDKGLLTGDPFGAVPHNAFTAYQTRDFLPPDMLARALDIRSDAAALRDPKRLTDRVVLLLLVDTALRRGELSSLERAQLRKSQGGYEIDLRAENQKGADKPAVALAVLYPETTQLLDTYLRWRDHVAGARGTHLILNQRKCNASDGMIADAVRREGERLNLRTCYRKRLPTPHDLRRTFAMNNASPLGLNMQAHELADRLRDDIQVVFRHYCRNNPLIASQRAQVYRGRLNGKCTAGEALGMVEKLAAIGVPRATIARLRKDVEQATAPAPAPAADRKWVAEEAVLDLVHREWGSTPMRRKFRDCIRSRGGLYRSGARGELRYDDAVVRALVEGYIPLSCLPLSPATARTVGGNPDVIRIGRDRLLPKRTALSLVIERPVAEQVRKSA